MVEQEKYVSRKRADLEVGIAKGKVSRTEDIGDTVTRISSSPNNEEECNDETLTDKEEQKDWNRLLDDEDKENVNDEDT